MLESVINSLNKKSNTQGAAFKLLLKFQIMKQVILVFISTLFIVSCSNPIEQPKVNKLPSLLLSNPSVEAECPFATTDHLNRVVISWVETEQKKNKFYYAVAKDNGTSFSQPILVPTANGLSAHHESMPKIAFKKDGTAFVVYQKRKPTPKNMYAGAIYYTQKAINDSSWSAPQYLHGDTNANIGRSFFDIARLSDGEIGTIWLDGRKRSRKGSTLFFVKTKGNQLDTEVEIAQKTCQCCRTELFVDEKNNINICFRDILQDSIRDIAFIQSTDNGESFSKPTIISNDNWVVNGCPHTGPSLHSGPSGLEFIWYTKGGEEGVYETNRNENSSFSKRKQVSPHAIHPQSANNSKGEVVIVWDEFFKTKTSYIKKVGVQLRGDSTVTRYITLEEKDSSYPVITHHQNGEFIVAWVEKYENKSVIKCKNIKGLNQ